MLKDLFNDLFIFNEHTDHLLPLVRDMRAHGSQPLKGIEYFLLFSIFRPVKDLGSLWNIGDSLLEKGGADDVPGQVLYRLLLNWLSSERSFRS
jgi:hypothetical protein